MPGFLPIMMELSTNQIQLLLLIFFLYLAWLLIRNCVSSKDEVNFLSSLPVVGLEQKEFAWMRATVLSVFKTKTWAFEGYDKFSKTNLPYVIPSIDRGPMVIIPPRQMRKVYGASDSIIDLHHTGNDTIQAKWTIGDKEVYGNNFQMNVIRNQLTRNLDKITPVIAKELQRAFKSFWGKSNDWHEVYVWDTCLKLVAGASNSIFVGEPLCRDDEFLDCLRDHAMSVFAGAMAINATPRPFKPVTGVVVSILCQYRLQRTLKKCLPTVEERLDNTAKLKADPNFDFTPPDDCLQWIIDECYATRDPAQLQPLRVAHRMVFLNDISLHSTAFMAQNLILDLFSTDPALGYVDTLREECAAVLAEAGGKWTRAAVVKLKLVDSCIRESMRLHPFAIVGLPRTVIHPDGILLEESGIRVPQGTLLAVPLEPVHYDESFYPEATRFDPFRFADPEKLRSLVDTFNPDEKGEKCNQYSADQATVGPVAKHKQSATLDDAFLGFGYGKNACPGRFFALNEVKVFVAHILLNYEVKAMKTRPRPVDTVWLKLPLHGGKVWVRPQKA